MKKSKISFHIMQNEQANFECTLWDSWYLLTSNNILQKRKCASDIRSRFWWHVHWLYCRNPDITLTSQLYISICNIIIIGCIYIDFPYIVDKCTHRIRNNIKNVFNISNPKYRLILINMYLCISWNFYRNKPHKNHIILSIINISNKNLKNGDTCKNSLRDHRRTKKKVMTSFVRKSVHYFIM